MSLESDDDTIVFSKTLPTPHGLILDNFIIPYIEIIGNMKVINASKGSFKELLSQKVTQTDHNF